MNISLIIFILVSAFFAYRGYRQGLAKSLSRILSLVSGYVAAILYSKPVSVLIQNEYQLQATVAFIIAAVTLFIAASVAASLIFWLIRKLLPGKAHRSKTSSLAGATTGLVIGVIVATVVIWSFAFIRDMWITEDDTTVANNSDNTVEVLANRVVGTAVSKVMTLGDTQPEISKLSTALFESPAEVAKQVQRLSSSNDLQALLQDHNNQAVLNSGDVSAVQKLPAFQNLINNPDMQALVKSSGLVNQSDPNSTAAKQVMASKLTDIWQRMQKVQNDERVQKILNDPDFQQKIQSGNPIDLMTNTRLLELAEIVFSDQATPEKQSATESEPTKPKKETQVYQWTDKYGRVHFTDEKPEP